LIPVLTLTGINLINTIHIETIENGQAFLLANYRPCLYFSRYTNIHMILYIYINSFLYKIVQYHLIFLIIIIFFFTVITMVNCGDIDPTCRYSKVRGCDCDVCYKYCFQKYHTTEGGCWPVDYWADPDKTDYKCVCI
jgi:hypothetical protein